MKVIADHFSCLMYMAVHVCVCLTMFKFCLSGQITNLELEVCTIKTQLEEILHRIKNTSKGELN